MFFLKFNLLSIDYLCLVDECSFKMYFVYFLVNFNQFSSIYPMFIINQFFNQFQVCTEDFIDENLYDLYINLKERRLSIIN